MTVTTSSRTDGPDTSVPGWQHAVALWGGIGLWMVHLTSVTALVGFACDEDALWTIHLSTVVTAVLTVAVTALALRLRRVDDGLAGEAHGFLGTLAVWMNGFSLALIIGEGLPPLFLPPC